MSDSASIGETKSVATLFSLGFKTVRRPRARDSDDCTLSEGEQPKKRKCVELSSYSSDLGLNHKKLDKANNFYKLRQSMDHFSFSDENPEEAMEVPASPDRTPERQIVSNRVEKTVPPTPRKKFHSELPTVLKDSPGPPSRIGVCACCGRLTKLRNSVPICLRLDCALQFAQ
ncbi:hypothetical protein GAYE_SCF08G3033 [Galdieria yellowstonensis]|uniref:Uncharacterized protein n=1 Tax=Galdieria yellowstonensis TaxID=3028027 RepID=A0AAV9ICU3_9RHOD|nr:hypothetical protein GAYE_SCF08G3033 [Galdieria yellowstonensis]